VSLNFIAAKPLGGVPGGQQSCERFRVRIVCRTGFDLYGVGFNPLIHGQAYFPSPGAPDGDRAAGDAQNLRRYF
jgi:hypothetical protein